MKAELYNAVRLTAGKITAADVSELARRFQRAEGLTEDGKLGPDTLAALRGTAITGELDELTIVDGWLKGAGVYAPKIPDWYSYDLMVGPHAIVWHTTATPHGTAYTMADRRVRGVAPNTSWHVSIEGDGAIYQMVSFDRGTKHAGRSKRIRNIHANKCAISIELVGNDAGPFPEPQVEGASRVARAVVRHFNIERAYADVTHAEIALPSGRKSDPGPVWAARHAAAVLNYAFA